MIGFFWVFGEWIYFFVVVDLDVNIIYLLIFWCVSFVVGFVLLVFFIGEKNVWKKLIVIGIFIVLMGMLIV